MVAKPRDSQQGDPAEVLNLGAAALSVEDLLVRPFKG